MMCFSLKKDLGVTDISDPIRQAVTNSPHCDCDSIKLPLAIIHVFQVQVPMNW